MVSPYRLLNVACFVSAMSAVANGASIGDGLQEQGFDDMMSHVDRLIRDALRNAEGISRNALDIPRNILSRLFITGEVNDGNGDNATTSPYGSNPSLTHAAEIISSQTSPIDQTTKDQLISQTPVILVDMGKLCTTLTASSGTQSLADLSAMGDANLSKLTVGASRLTGVPAMEFAPGNLQSFGECYPETTKLFKVTQG